jgi:5-methylcytosine-specific restriction endonuclease McrA
MTARRGTSNRNDRGSAANRRRRREWLVETYRANQDLSRIGPCNPGWGEPACRCYRCGTLLTVETVTVDRIIPGCMGGTYRRENIRPACGTCNSATGGILAGARKRAAS